MVSNEENYLSILSTKNIENILSPTDVLTIKAKLWEVLEKRAESYTMGGSSSLRIETAQELLKSACFVIGHGLKHDLGHGIGYDTDTAIAPEFIKEQLLKGNFDTLFRVGLEAIEAQVKEGMALLAQAVSTVLNVENGAYRDTLRELDVFFKRYHYHHFAHEIPCMIDYPLAYPVDEALLGIDYINEYLRRLVLENTFCGRFEAETVAALLKSVAPDYKENILSIYESVAANALALTLVKGDATSLDVTERDLDRLYSLFGEKIASGTAAALLASAASELCDILGIDNDAEKAYLARTASALGARLEPALKTKQLGHIFPPLYREKEDKKHTVTYIDGARMDNEKLRALIDEITSCRYVSDKIALARQNVHSLRDWAEILNICFWGDELPALFSMFNDDELGLLLRFVKEQKRKHPSWASETGWEKIIDEYVNDNHRKA